MSNFENNVRIFMNWISEGKINNKRELLRALLIVTAICLIPIWGFLLQNTSILSPYLVGVQPHQYNTWYSVLIFPALHADFVHLTGNLSAMFVLLFMLYNGFSSVFFRIIIPAWVIPGIFVLFFGRSGEHIGASGFVYAIASFIFFAGIVIRHFTLIAQSLVVVFLYGGIFWGIFPMKQEISWEGHLAGFSLGIILVGLLKSKLHQMYPKHPEVEDDDENDDQGEEEAYWKIPNNTFDSPNSNSQKS